MKITVLIADENRLFRELLSSHFSKTEEIEAIAEATDSQEILDLVKRTQPDIILMDNGLPRMKGMETTKILRRDFPDCKVIALTSRAEKIHIKGMLESGACGYYLKDCTFDQLVTAIQQIHSGKKAVSTDVENIIIDDYLGRHQTHATSLTDRENQILNLLAEGKSIKEISENLFISIKTVCTHKQNIFDKMGFENLAQLIKYALNNGIVH